MPNPAATSPESPPIAATVEQAAQLLSLSVNQFRNMAKDGRLGVEPVGKVGARILYSRAALIDWFHDGMKPKSEYRARLATRALEQRLSQSKRKAG